MSILRIACAFFTLLASASVQAKEASTALFCNGGGQGRAMKLFAGQKLANGNLKFGVTVWHADGQNFSVFGIAKPSRSGWVYEERQGQPSKVVCRLRVDWRNMSSVRLAGDKNANCEGNAGHGFGRKNVTFASTDFRGAVSAQLADAETFMNTDCPKQPGKRL